ncbi:spore germination protein [Bacillus sp. FJAT-44742]|uniref:spore germination protein n=1 Tax=Bacillus sp. FJAT-44742 TaxID=2014005 RepID=UPI000C23246C|nr:spore germination protein [Bacillus sp. FJAT-44742]
MPVINNIFNIKINNISSNASVNFGNAVHEGHNVNDKSQGTNTAIGDLSPLSAWNKNQLLDPDVNDMVTNEPEFLTKSVNSAKSI